MIPNITTGADFGGLVDYLFEHRDHELLDMRGVSSVELAAKEMEAVAALSNRATVKLIHLSLSAAHEDGKLEGDRWLEAVDRHEGAFGLNGHQRVVVRHKDKAHDHAHVFWCTISIETGQTPPKRWFLRKGFAVVGVGPQALTDAQVARIPAAHRARRSYDFILLRRAQHLCRQLERDFGLRVLRSPEQAAKARLAGEERAPSSGQQKRAERTGAAPLVGCADEIRDALDHPDWPSKRRALAAIGLDFEPVFRTTKKGEELRGLVIFDRADPGNRMKASQLDTAAVKYGWRKLEARHRAGTASLGQWWSEREPLPLAPPGPATDPAARLRGSFDLLIEQYRLSELEKRSKLKQLRKEQKLAVALKRRALMRERKEGAAALKPSERRDFYRTFHRTVRAPALGALAAQHRDQASKFGRSRKPVWREFVHMRVEAGDREAVRLVAVQARNTDKSVERAVQLQSQVARSRPTWTFTPAPQAQSQPASPTSALSPEQLLKALEDYRARGR